jgi:hypothetical protein
MDKSPLARLPHELKLDVFERVLYAEKGVKVIFNKPVSPERKRLSMRTYARQPHPLAIQATCKEIAKDTAGLVFKVNDSWSFVAMDDDTTAWGYRIQKWCHRIAGKQCLDRARLVQFDIGAWDSFPSRRPRGSISLLLHTQIGAMYQNLPKQLRQCEQEFKLRIIWSSGIKRADGSRSSPGPIILIVPLWTTKANIQAAVEKSIWRAEGRHKYSYFRPPTETEISNWRTQPSSRQVTQAEKRHEAKETQEINAFIKLSRQIDVSCCRDFTPDMRRRLEEHAFYP